MKKNHLKFCGAPLAIGIVLTSCSSYMSSDRGYNFADAPGFYSNHQTSFLPSLEVLPREAFTAQQAQNWWQDLKDPLLNFLVYETLQQSFDTRRALTNVEQAEAILRGVRADRLPSISLNGEINTEDYTDIDVRAGIGGQWNPDLFGKARQNVKQAQSSLISNQALARDVRRLVLTRMTQTYIAYRTTEARIDLNQGNLERLIEKRSRIQRLVDSGYSSRLDLDRSETQISQIQSNIAALKAQKISTRNALALFMRASPKTLQDWLARKPNSLTLPDKIPEPRLDYIVRHRPDIRSAEWALISANHGKQSAELALYPDITLNGSIFSISGLTSMTNLGNVASSLVTNIAQPLLGRGRLLAGIDQQTSRVNQALLDYEETVFQAVLDIDTALSNWKRRNEQQHFDQKTLDTAIEAQSRAQKLFFAGQESFTAVIVAENTRLAAEDRYLLSRQAAFNSYVNYTAAVVPNW